MKETCEAGVGKLIHRLNSDCCGESNSRGWGFCPSCWTVLIAEQGAGVCGCSDRGQGLGPRGSGRPACRCPLTRPGLLAPPFRKVVLEPHLLEYLPNAGEPGCCPFPAPFPLLILVHSGGSKALPDVPLETGLCSLEAKTYITSISDPLRCANQLPLWLRAVEPPVMSGSRGVTSTEARVGLAGAAVGGSRGWRRPLAHLRPHTCSRKGALAGPGKTGVRTHCPGFLPHSAWTRDPFFMQNVNVGSYISGSSERDLMPRPPACDLRS